MIAIRLSLLKTQFIYFLMTLNLRISTESDQKEIN